MSTIHFPIPNLPVKPGDSVTWGNLHGCSIGLMVSEIIAKHVKPLVIITPDTITATRLGDELAFFYGATTQESIIHFPDWETLPYDNFSPHQDIISERLSALYRLPSLSKGVLIISISTLMHRLAPPDYLNSNVFLLQQNQHMNIEAVRLHLEKGGYRAVNQVREHGEFAVRGSLIDIFPMGSELPFRIDLFGDEIDSIRTFSPDNQRSIEQVAEIRLLPAKEFPLTPAAIEFFRQAWRSQFSGNPLNCPLYQDVSEGICPPGIEYYLPLFFEKTATLFDYLPKTSLIVRVGNTHAKAEEFWQEVYTRHVQRGHDLTHPLLTPTQVFIPTEETFARMNELPSIQLQEAEVSEQAGKYNFATHVSPALSIDHKATQPLATLNAFLTTHTHRILFCAETNGRREILLDLFKSINLQPKNYLSWQEFLADAEPYGITVAALDEGVELDDANIIVIAEAQLYGKRVMQRRRRKDSTHDIDAMIRDLAELEIGAAVVHIDHGVGRYLGLQTLTVAEQVAEFLCLEYAGGDKLYVPVASLHLIGRYSGADLENAPLNKLGTEQWQKAKRKAAEQVRDTAAELLNIYAKRSARPGHAFAIPDEQYAAFAAAFPFEETPDQQRAIDQVLQDMNSDNPMDRLVCGDVGFGKTEVAMRAAFVAVQSGKQVAILVPTTLLAQQHYQNFQDRFANWPIRVASLSRFKSNKEQQQVIDQLETGGVDIVIGTHKLLQPNIKFKNLGLVAIDEEHRFGVRQKERLKALRSEVDILTLTATPIPRTLNMAFAGIRDLSLIATPPARRLSIKTFVLENNDSVIQEALLREIMRGGQVYYLHNEVSSIEKAAQHIASLVPEARIGIAHGQLRESELEHVMADFYHRRFNVLVCSTIIESGIDVPSANTIIMDRADKLGMAQLHQLRGRVGRSHHQAYAYLLTPSRKSMTADALKRLDAIAALEDLGIGFTLATQDLEIRGAGELLGEGQSGNMHAIGFTLYMELLSRAVAALKAGKEPDLELSLSHGTEIDLQIPALIPDIYLADVHLRLQCYKRIASTKTAADLDDLQVEMIDRFGLLPQSLKNLFQINYLKLSAAPLGIIKIEANSKGGRIEFVEKPPIDPMRIINLIQKQPDRFQLSGNSRLKFVLNEHLPEQRIELVERVLKLLS